ncbi:MAG TPA: aminotransferase class IV [Bryobacteraceae bacterium]|nr:aminotransferase class IV [Bryobacteraceae bacterium]
MIHRFVLHNDAILDSTQPCLSPGQAGLLAGWGVFSTLRVNRGVLFAWDRHYARMKRDAENLRVPFPDDAGWMEQQLLKVVEANGANEATLRVVVVNNGGSAWAGPSERRFDLLALTTGLTDWGTDVRLGVVHNARLSTGRFSGAKTTSWAWNLVWHNDAHEAGFDEVVLLNEHGEVAECTSANIFVVRGHDVLTPPLSAGCLPGVTRELLLSQVRIPDVRVQEATLTPPDLESADEVFITSTTRDCLPVAAIGAIATKGGHEICDQLRAALSAWRSAWVDARLNAPAFSR